MGTGRWEDGSMGLCPSTAGAAFSPARTGASPGNRWAHCHSRMGRAYQSPLHPGTAQHPPRVTYFAAEPWGTHRRHHFWACARLSQGQGLFTPWLPQAQGQGREGTGNGVCPALAHSTPHTDAARVQVQFILHNREIQRAEVFLCFLPL